MKRLALSLVAVVALAGGFGNQSSAFDWTMPGASQDVYASTTQLPLVAIGDCAGDCACDDSCCDSCGGMIFDIELTFVKYGQEGGVNDFDGSPGSFDYEIAPRLELGYIRADGFGVRGRFWWFDHSTLSVTGEPIEVDTYSLDAEFFQIIDLSGATTLDIAGGVRYLNFDQTIGSLIPALDSVVSHFDGFGLTTALNLRKQALNGNLYAKTRLSILAGDIQVRDNGVLLFTGFDHPVTQVELGIGYEAVRYLDSGSALRLRAGLEYQQWLNIVLFDDGFHFHDTTVDATFFGFVTGIGLDY